MAETILIGGTSHTGKTTLAGQLATLTAGHALSTDAMGRHPGRPWPEVKPHVAEFYERLSADVIFQFLLIHHDNLWPGIRARIAQQQAATSAPLLILEGCALRPELAVEFNPSHAVWLFASDDFLTQRMLNSSSYQQAEPAQRAQIDAFIVRSLRDNAAVISQARRLGLTLLDVEDPSAATNFVAQCQAELIS